MILFLWLLLVVLFIVLSTVRWKMHPFLALLVGAIAMGFLAGLEGDAILSSISGGFGSTLGSIGIVIAIGALIGEYLDRSGGAMVLASRILQATGEKRAPLSMSITGFVVSIPVFCDSGFIVLSSLKRAIAGRTGIPLVTLAIALATGLYTTHVFVPPTPGPLAAAVTLGADIGWVMMMGLVVSIPVAAVGLIWAIRIGRRHEGEPAVSTEAVMAGEAVGDAVADGGMSGPVPADAGVAGQGMDEADLVDAVNPARSTPGFWNSLLPILVPILLIAVRSVAEYPTSPLGEGTIKQALSFLGNPVVALTVGVFLSFGLVNSGNRIRGEWLEEGLAKAGSIILITGAGGAFGEVLRMTELSDLSARFAMIGGLGILVPFLISAFLKTAQGSSTVAIITASAIVAPLVIPMGFNTQTGTALVVLAVCAGSLTVSHVNDSFFWVVSRFSDMDLKTALRTHTLATLWMGLTALAVIQLMAWILV